MNGVAVVLLIWLFQTLVLGLVVCTINGYHRTSRKYVAIGIAVLSVMNLVFDFLVYGVVSLFL